MGIEGLPKWMNVIPALLGVAFAIAGMYLLPHYGVRNTFGPIIGLPAGMIVGAAILAAVAKRKH